MKCHHLEQICHLLKIHIYNEIYKDTLLYFSSVVNFQQSPSSLHIYLSYNNTTFNPILAEQNFEKYNSGCFEKHLLW